MAKTSNSRRKISEQAIKVFGPHKRNFDPINDDLCYDLLYKSGEQAPVFGIQDQTTATEFLEIEGSGKDRKFPPKDNRAYYTGQLSWTTETGENMDGNTWYRNKDRDLKGILVKTNPYGWQEGTILHHKKYPNSDAYLQVRFVKKAQ